MNAGIGAGSVAGAVIADLGLAERASRPSSSSRGSPSWSTPRSRAAPGPAPRARTRRPRSGSWRAVFARPPRCAGSSRRSCPVRGRLRPVRRRVPRLRDTSAAVGPSVLALAFTANAVTIVACQLPIGGRLELAAPAVARPRARRRAGSAAWLVSLGAGHAGAGTVAAIGFVLAMILFALGETALAPSLGPLVNDLASEPPAAATTARQRPRSTGGFLLGPLAAGALSPPGRTRPARSASTGLARSPRRPRCGSSPPPRRPGRGARHDDAVRLLHRARGSRSAASTRRPKGTPRRACCTPMRRAAARGAVGLGNVLRAQARYDEAEEHLREALDARRGGLDPAGPQPAGPLNALAVPTSTRGRFDEAHRSSARAQHRPAYGRPRAASICTTSAASITRGGISPRRSRSPGTRSRYGLRTQPGPARRRRRPRRARGDPRGLVRYAEATTLLKVALSVFEANSAATTTRSLSRSTTSPRSRSTPGITRRPRRSPARADPSSNGSSAPTIPTLRSRSTTSRCAGSSRDGRRRPSRCWTVPSRSSRARSRPDHPTLAACRSNRADAVRTPR